MCDGHHKKILLLATLHPSFLPVRRRGGGPASRNGGGSFESAPGTERERPPPTGSIFTYAVHQQMCASIIPCAVRNGSTLDASANGRLDNAGRLTRMPNCPGIWGSFIFRISPVRSAVRPRRTRRVDTASRDFGTLLTPFLNIHTRWHSGLIRLAHCAKHRV